MLYNWRSPLPESLSGVSAGALLVSSYWPGLAPMGAGQLEAGSGQLLLTSCELLTGRPTGASWAASWAWPAGTSWELGEGKLEPGLRYIT